MDLLSHALAIIRLTGAVVFRVDVNGPWCITSAASSEDFANNLPAGTNHIIAFHLVVAGECWFRCPPGEWIRTQAGDAVVLPYANIHELGDHPDDDPIHFTKLLGNQSLNELRDLEFKTGEAPHVEILCGFLGCDRRAFAPLFASLPPMFITRLKDSAAGLIRYALSEALNDEPGTASLRTRMAELMFLETLRGYMQELPRGATGWLAALRDPIISKTLRLMHESPSHQWTVESIADRVACSRSLLADRFKSVVGETPMHYLTELRMQQAARRLSDSHAKITAIAEEVGYASSAAFQRAFKRSFGMPPAAWRRAATTRAGGAGDLTES